MILVELRKFTSAEETYAKVFSLPAIFLVTFDLGDSFVKPWAQSLAINR